MPCAIATPAKAPAICITIYGSASERGIFFCHASERVTMGLKCAPEIAPNIRINAINPAPVAIALASNAIATFPPARRSAIIPDPTTTASRKEVPNPSETRRLTRLMLLWLLCDQVRVVAPVFLIYQLGGLKTNQDDF